MRPSTRSTLGRVLTTSAALAALSAGVPAVSSAWEGSGGATGTARPAVPLRGSAYVETRLFFGTERPDGGPAVTDREFSRFVDQEVTPGFPDGLTVQEGRGQWRDRHGTIERERSYELILLCPVGEARSRDALIERIRDAYERRYGQESVGRLEIRTRADFG
ncbi:DUF3574 domain-containing protein [Streptomyces sp. NPDC059578]|uniref:DUF3574 domain-containing protein n=1 Tax=Streptomyces sp. NPDC059578 TaxID=3346874 RepID=UPI0036815859